MHHVLPSAPLLAAFVLASMLLAVTPGPAVIYILTRTLAHGRRAGLASVMAVALGNFGNALGAAVGLAALFAVSSLAFTVVKYAGAAYLIWMGVRALTARPVAQAAGEAVPAPVARSQWRIFRDGFVVALMNPKTTLFFAAFLPQFMNPAAPAMPQSIALGSLFVAIAGTSDVCYVLAASLLRPWLARARGAMSIGRYLTGVSFIGLGIFTALSGGRKPA